MNTAVYIHIPYCKSKCIYCDFLSSPDLAISPAKYLQALELELALRSRELREAAAEVDTIYIGGGTPTVLAASELSALLSACRTHLPLTSGTEWTVEVNPGTIDRPKASVLRAGGVNRISLGVQDTNDHRLALLGRIHTFSQAKQAFSLCRDFFGSVSVDAISGLPGQKAADYAKTVRDLCGWQPDHFSLYGLKVEAGTRLAELLEGGELTLPSEEETLTMMHQGREILIAHGFKHYELANFAKPGHQCRHNLSYWENSHYLGLGLGAHSYWRSSRCCNTADLGLYQNALQAGMLPPATIHYVQKREEMEDTMMLGLRLVRGVSFKEFERRFQVDLRTLFAAEIHGLAERGLVEYDSETIRLSRRGLPLANLVFAEFISA